MAEHRELENQPKDMAATQGETQEMDLAGKSLTDALRISFGILKIIMVVLVVLFLTSGIFSVQQNENAMILRLGKIRPIGGKRVLDSGLKWTWPAPISEIVKIPVQQIQTIQIDKFWYFLTEQEKLRGQPNSYSGPTLDPVRDGYVLTRNDRATLGEATDYNIVHSRWQLSYRISDAEAFFTNIYYSAPKPGQDFLDVAGETLDPLLRAMASDAIVATMVHYTIDEAIRGEIGIAENVRRRLQEKLNEIGSGVTVVDMQVLGKITWPRQVDQAFQESNRASQQKQQLITEAQQYASTLLNETGGPNAATVLASLKDPNVTQEQKELLLLQLSGQSREQIAQARAYRTKTVEDARANASYLDNLLAEYRARPKLVLQKIYQDAVQEVLENADEKIIVRSSGDENKELRVLINRDPEIRKKKPQENQRGANAGR